MAASLTATTLENCLGIYIYGVFQKDVLTPIGNSFSELISYEKNSCKIQGFV
jgi:hypothetical protein